MFAKVPLLYILCCIFFLSCAHTSEFFFDPFFFCLFFFGPFFCFVPYIRVRINCFRTTSPPRTPVRHRQRKTLSPNLLIVQKPVNVSPKSASHHYPCWGVIFLPLLAFCLLGLGKVGKCVVNVKKYERDLLKCEIQIRKWVESKFHEFWWMWKVVKCERWCGAQRKPDEVCQGRRQRCERRTAEVCPWFLSGILRPFCWSSQSFWGVGGEDWRVGSKIVLVFTFIRVLDVLEIDVVHGDWKLGFHSFLKLKKSCLLALLSLSVEQLTNRPLEGKFLAASWCENIF